MSVKLILLKPENQEHRLALEEMLLEFSNEVYHHNQSDVDQFISYHYAIYLAIDSDGEIAGFSSFTVNGYYGLRSKTIGNDYVYLRPHIRGTKAIYLFMLQAAKVVEELQLPIEHYIATDDSAKMMPRLNDAPIYSVYLTEVDQALEAASKLERIVRIKK